jgi:hypothetical protein
VSPASAGLEINASRWKCRLRSEASACLDYQVICVSNVWIVRIGQSVAEHEVKNLGPNLINLIVATNVDQQNFIFTKKLKDHPAVIRNAKCPQSFKLSR